MLVLAHHPQNPLAGGVDPAQLAQLGPDLAVALAGERAALDERPDLLVQLLVAQPRPGPRPALAMSLCSALCACSLLSLFTKTVENSVETTPQALTPAA